MSRRPGSIVSGGVIREDRVDPSRTAAAPDVTPSGGISGVFQVEMLPRGINSGGSGGTYLRSQHWFDPTEFDGELTFEIETVGNNSDVVAYAPTVGYSGGVVGTFDVVPTAGLWRRHARQTFSPDLTQGQIYLVTTPGATSGIFQLQEVRLIVTQVNGTKHTSVFPMACGAWDGATTIDASIGDGDLDRSANHLGFGNLDQWFTAGGCTPFKYVASEWATIEKFRFGALISGGAYAILLDLDTNTQVAESEVNTVGLPAGDPCWISSEFAASVLTDGHTYAIQLRCNSPFVNAKFFGASLAIVLNPATRSQAYFRYVKQAGLSTLKLRSDATNDVGTSSVVDVPGVDLDASGMFAIVRSGALADGIVSGRRYIAGSAFDSSRFLLPEYSDGAFVEAALGANAVTGGLVVLGYLANASPTPSACECDFEQMVERPCSFTMRTEC